MRRIIAFVGACLLALAPLAAHAQTNPTLGPLAFSTTTSGNVITVPLSGQATCAVTVYSIASATITAQASSDGTVYSTATGVNGGSISTTGTFSGNVAATGLTQFRLVATGVSGTLSGAVTCSSPVASVGAPSATAGFAAQRYYPPNTLGGGCNGVTGATIGTGTPISKLFYGPNSGLAPSTVLTQIIALAPTTMIHICSLAVTSVMTVAGTVSLSYGTGANCATGNVGLITMALNGVAGNAGTVLALGAGETGVFDVPTGNALCISSSGYTAINGPFVNITYAQY